MGGGIGYDRKENEGKKGGREWFKIEREGRNGKRRERVEDEKGKEERKKRGRPRKSGKIMNAERGLRGGSWNIERRADVRRGVRLYGELMRMMGRKGRDFEGH